MFIVTEMIYIGILLRSLSLQQGSFFPCDSEQKRCIKAVLEQVIYEMKVCSAHVFKLHASKADKVGQKPTTEGGSESRAWCIVFTYQNSSSMTEAFTMALLSLA